MLNSQPEHRFTSPYSIMSILSLWWEFLVKPDKSRYVYLYLPSAEEKARWGDLAKKAGVPLTKFVIEIVENALADDAEFKPRGELTKEISALRKEVKDLRDELKLKNIVLDKYETELKRYRSAAFLVDDLLLCRGILG